MSGHYGGNPYAWDGGANAPHISRYFIARGWCMPGETVLDAGCGSGYGTHMIAQVVGKNGHVIGVDVDDGQINQAQDSWGYENTEYRILDLGKDELPDVDVLISIEVPEHINGLEHFIEQAKKHTKRMMLIGVPLGGTSYAYTEEEKAKPAGENNDFNNMSHLQELFQDKTWKVQSAWEYGYSGMAVFFKKPPKRIKSL
jgi:SAM-dependent methyltransferase